MNSSFLVHFSFLFFILFSSNIERRLYHIDFIIIIIINDCVHWAIIHKCETKKEMCSQCLATTMSPNRQHSLLCFHVQFSCATLMRKFHFMRTIMFSSVSFLTNRPKSSTSVQSFSSFLRLSRVHILDVRHIRWWCVCSWFFEWNEVSKLWCDAH